MSKSNFIIQIFSEASENESEIAWKEVSATFCVTPKTIEYGLSILFCEES